MKILIFGNGVMANILKNSIENPDKFVDMVNPLTDLKKYEDFDVIIDFSNYMATEKLLNLALKYKKPVLIATTGHEEKQIDLIKQASKEIPIIIASNTSTGVLALNQLVKKAAELLNDFEVEIVEYHHNRKIDSPSGTAKTIANEIISIRSELESKFGRTGKREKNELGISSVRAGSIVGKHEVLFAGEDEIVTITHEAFSRKIFALGAIRIARGLLDKKNGLYLVK